MGLRGTQLTGSIIYTLVIRKMHKNATKYNETLSKWCKNKHGASKIIDMFETYQWVLFPIYGAAQDDKKPDFLAELVRTCDNEEGPLLIGGDFNILRHKEDKNNENFNGHWPFMFNAIIESLDLREIAMSDRQYTWANRRANPTFEKLDRILASVDWENKFPLVFVRALTRSGSDHTPLLIDSGEQTHLGNKSHFSFELSWLRQDGFSFI
jgi:hypothetical protein